MDGRYTENFYIDLGATNFDFHYPFAEKNGFLKRKGFDSFELAGYVIKDPIISFPLEKPSGSFGESEIKGNIGNDLLRRFVLYLDYSRKKLIVEKGADFDRRFPENMCGLGVYFNERGQMEVVFVPPHTPGAEAGFLAGDIILAVNDIGVEHLNGLTALSDLMRAEAGTEYKFTIIRGGTKKSLKLKLANLFD